MEKRTRTHHQIIMREMLLRFKQERTLVRLFLAALVYSLISNIVSKCCPIECDIAVANMGNAVDELVKNICYSIIAGVIFYFINDIYRGVVNRVSDMDNMFRELVSLYSNARDVLLIISNSSCNNNMDRKEVYKCVMKHLCDEDVEFHLFGNPYKSHTIGVDDCAILVSRWKDECKKQRDFLAVYGELLEKQEVYRLNDYDDSLVNDIASCLSKEIEKTSSEYFQISDYNITVLVNRIIHYKYYITNLAKKYVRYNYRIHFLNRLCEEDDFV